jgi:sec-independent protein translocase protein TatA
MFKSFGIWELLLVLLIALLIFGAARLPQIGESLGKAIRSFRKSFSGDEDKKNEQTAASREDKGGDGSKPAS